MCGRRDLKSLLASFCVKMAQMEARSVAGSPAAMSPQSMMAEMFLLSIRIFRACRSPWIQVRSVSMGTAMHCSHKVLMAGVMRVVEDSSRWRRDSTASVRWLNGTDLKGL